MRFWLPHLKFCEIWRFSKGKSQNTYQHRKIFAPAARISFQNVENIDFRSIAAKPRIFLGAGNTNKNTLLTGHPMIYTPSSLYPALQDGNGRAAPTFMCLADNLHAQHCLRLSSHQREDSFLNWSNRLSKCCMESRTGARGVWTCRSDENWEIPSASPARVNMFYVIFRNEIPKVAEPGTHW